MAPLPAPEPSKLLETLETMDARKIRFERNRIRLPMGVEGTFGIIRHPGASLAVPITADGQVVILRQYRFAVQARLLEFPAGTLEEGEDPLESMQRELGRRSWIQRCPLGFARPDVAVSWLFRRSDSLLFGAGAHAFGASTRWR
jgi:ADP-ribose pyrophosphatase